MRKKEVPTLSEWAPRTVRLTLKTSRRVIVEEAPNDASSLTLKFPTLGHHLEPEVLEMQQNDEATDQ
jgi:hypothetical protein